MLLHDALSLRFKARCVPTIDLAEQIVSRDLGGARVLVQFDQTLNLLVLPHELLSEVVVTAKVFRTDALSVFEDIIRLVQ